MIHHDYPNAKHPQFWCGYLAHAIRASILKRNRKPDEADRLLEAALDEFRHSPVCDSSQRDKLRVKGA